MYPIDPIPGRLVTLREFRHEDVADAFAIVGDDRVTRWLSFDSRDRDQAATMIDGAIQRAQAEPRTEYYLAVADRADRMIGFA